MCVCGCVCGCVYVCVSIVTLSVCLKLFVCLSFCLKMFLFVVLRTCKETQEQLEMVAFLEAGACDLSGITNPSLDAHLLKGLQHTFMQHPLYLTALVETVCFMITIIFHVSQHLVFLGNPPPPASFCSLFATCISFTV